MNNFDYIIIGAGSAGCVLANRLSENPKNKVLLNKMFKSYIYKIALRYFFSKDSKTIVNRINGFSFIMIVAAACVLQAS